MSQGSVSERRSRARQAILAIVGLAVIILTVTIGGVAGFGTSPNSQLDDSPHFNELPNLSAESWFNVKEPLTWKSLRGRPVLIEFWATWCVPCLENVPMLRRLQEEYEGRGLVVIGMTRDPASKVNAYVRRFSMNYAVGVGQPATCNTNVTSIPYAVLISAEGRIVWQGHPAGQEDTIRKRLSSVSTSVSPSPKLLSLGATTGVISSRPNFAREFDEGSLQIEFDRLRDRIDRLTADDCQRFFDFYWKNRPADGWPGDASARKQSIFYFAMLAVQVRKTGNRDLLDIFEQELKKRLRLDNLPYEERKALYGHSRICLEKNDPESIELLDRLRSRETNPLALVTIEEVLDELDPSRPTSPKSKSELASERFNQAYDRTWTKWFGLPAELRKADEYIKHLCRGDRLGQSITESLLRSFESDYRAHGDDSVGSLIIRGQVLYTLTEALPGRVRSDSQLRRVLQEVVFNIIEMNDPDPGLRAWAVSALEATSLDTLDKARLLTLADSRLRTEQHRRARRSLEWLKLAVTNPKLLD